MMQIFEPNELAVMDIENLRLHYSRTIQHWAERFEQHKSVICKMMDEPFVRAWSLYLYGSIAAFNVGSLQLFQVVFNPLHKNDLPRSRAYMYPQENNTVSTVETFESR
jgi:cyclopropane-fatty-acyl-phospholipid synthase